jgi:hypothetical protein
MLQRYLSLGERLGSILFIQDPGLEKWIAHVHKNESFA